jgi:hypothetical protein
MAVLDFDDRFGILRNGGQFRSVLRAAGGDAIDRPVTPGRSGGVGTPTRVPARSVLFCASAARPVADELRRLQRFARALGVRPQVLLRGTGATVRVARAMGWTVLDATPQAILGLQPDLAVVDDAAPALVRLWVRVARLFDLPVATIRDLSLRLATAPADDVTAIPGWIPADARAQQIGEDALEADVPGRTLLAIAGGGPRQSLGTRFMSFMAAPAAADAAAGLVA